MRITVIGGGVAGSASAIALARMGADVTVYEAYEDPAGPVGSFISLAVNGLRALDALEVVKPVQQAGFPVARQRMWSGRGKQLGEVARNRRPSDELLSITLMRADLVTELRTAAREAGATIVTGQRVTGDQAADADLTVGADAIWSATRRTLDPNAPEPAYSGIYSVSGTSTRPPGIAQDGFNWIFAKRGVFIYLPAPDGTVWWTAQVSSKQPPATVLTAKDAAAADLAELYRTEPQAGAILARSTAIRPANLGHVLRPVTRRHDDRTVLIGDAARPAGAGQAASMTLEDAVILARRLADSGTIPQALAAFDAERQPRAGKMARMATKNRDAKTAGPIAARMREVIMAHVFNRFYEGATGWLYDFDLATARDTKSSSDVCP